MYVFLFQRKLSAFIPLESVSVINLLKPRKYLRISRYLRKLKPNKEIPKFMQVIMCASLLRAIVHATIYKLMLSVLPYFEVVFYMLGISL